jgi:hypothetical protein
MFPVGYVQAQIALIIDMDDLASQASVELLDTAIEQTRQQKIGMVIIKPLHVSLSERSLQTVIERLKNVQSLTALYLSESALVQSDEMTAILSSADIVALKKTVTVSHHASWTHNNLFYVASLSDFLVQLNTQPILLNATPQQLKTNDWVFQYLKLDWRSQAIALMASSNFIFTLLMIGVNALIFEFNRPGNVRAATIASICLLLALFALQKHEVNYFVIALLFMSIGMMAYEVMKSHRAWCGLLGLSFYIYVSQHFVTASGGGAVISVELMVLCLIATILMLLASVGGLLKRKWPIS